MNLSADTNKSVPIISDCPCDSFNIHSKMEELGFYTGAL